MMSASEGGHVKADIVRELREFYFINQFQMRGRESKNPKILLPSYLEAPLQPDPEESQNRTFTPTALKFPCVYLLGVRFLQMFQLTGQERVRKSKLLAQ